MVWEEKTVRYEDLDVTISYTRKNLRGQRYIYLADIAIGQSHRFVLSHPSPEGLSELLSQVVPVAYYARFQQELPVETFALNQSQEVVLCRKR